MNTDTPRDVVVSGADTDAGKTFARRLALACVPAIVGAGVLVFTGATPAALLEKLGPVSEGACLAAIAFLPLIGFPLAPLYAFAGLRFGWTGGYALAMAGVAINLLLAYPVFGKLLRRPTLALLAKRGWNPETWRRGDRLRATILIASVPALPFWAQNAVLAAIDTPWRLYFTVSLIAQAIFAAAGVSLGMLGREALGTSTGTLLLLLAFPISVIVLRRLKMGQGKS